MSIIIDSILMFDESMIAISLLVLSSTSNAVEHTSATFYFNAELTVTTLWLFIRTPNIAPQALHTTTDTGICHVTQRSITSTDTGICHQTRESVMLLHLSRHSHKQRPWAHPPSSGPDSVNTYIHICIYTYIYIYIYIYRYT